MPDRIVLRDTGLTKAVERQMRNWELARSQSQLTSPAKRDPNHGVFDFVSIANDVGGGGEDVVNMLSDRLNWPVFDREILSAMAADDEVRMRMYRSMDERDLNWFEEAMRTFVHGEFLKNDYFHRLTETLLCLARQSHAIFIGRAADLILPRSKGLRVKVICSYDRRLANFAARTGTTPKEAAKQVDRIHRDRAAFIYNRFQIDILEPTRFDLLIHSERFTPEQAVEIILHAMKLRGLTT
ncbi:MAG TPA: cytidylate kinase-like family protein [Phycisphaerae bacterium]|nr:cytidylate kinase-like family protein [Phycisphaerae bacterium]